MVTCESSLNVWTHDKRNHILDSVFVQRLCVARCDLKLFAIDAPSARIQHKFLCGIFPLTIRAIAKLRKKEREPKSPTEQSVSFNLILFAMA